MIGSRAIHIVALAARTPVGFRASATAAAVRARVSRVARHPVFVDAGGDFVRCGYDEDLGPKVYGNGRLLALGRAALREMAGALPSVPLTSGAVPVLLALPEPRPGLTAADAHAVARGLALVDANTDAKLDIREAGSGHAGVILGIAQASGMIARHDCEICIVGATDGYLEGATLDWLEDNRMLDCEEARSGFAPGEGAAFVALADGDACARYGLSKLATLRAAAVTNETRDPNGPEGPLGEAMTEAIFRVGASLARPHELLDDHYCDINGERSRVTDLGFALLRAAELFRGASDYRTCVSQVGDIGAASAALSCILATRAWARGYATGPTALVSAASWSGLRGALILTKTEL